jgi:hypothetical protein
MIPFGRGPYQTAVGYEDIAIVGDEGPTHFDGKAVEGTAIRELSGTLLDAD